MRIERLVPMAVLAAVSIAVLALSGCPLIRPLNYTFTSADSSAGRNAMYNGLFPGARDTSEDTSGENEVERELVEPDVIRRAGNLLYVLNQYRGLTIVDLDAEEMLAQAPTYGYPRDLYLVGDLAYVLVGYATNFVAQGDTVKMEAGSRVFVVDIANPRQPSVINTFDLDGDFVDSRLVGGVLYAVSANFQWYWEDGVVGGGVAVDTASSGTWAKQQTSESWVTSVNVADPEHIAVVDSLSFNGYGNIIQATNYAIFVAASDWYTNASTITYIDISDPAGAIQVRGACNVKGYIADRFKMDAWNGVLRVVSNTNWQDRDVYVTTINLADPDALTVLGEKMIEGASGETLFATRFDGPRAYIVTYFVVDPLFVLDLSDPANPHLAGMLEVPGWSVHIEPRGDRLIALGVDDSGGTRRVKVSLFDVADPEQPTEKAVVSMGDDWSWSSAFSDVKAFTVLEDKLIVPFSGWTAAGGYDRLQFVSYTRDTLELGGHVDLQGQILRSFQYGELYYGVTTEQLAVIDNSGAGGPAVINRLTLAEYIADFHELSGEVSAEIVSQFEDGSTVVRTVSPEGAALGSVTVENLSNITSSFAYGSSVLLISTGWDETGGYYQVVQVDCSVPEAPVAGTPLRVDVQPYWGGWYWYDYRPGDPIALRSVEKQRMMAPYYWYPWWDSSENIFLVGDLLVLRCYSDKFDETLGPDAPSQGIALVDLSAGEWASTVGLGYDDIQALDAANGKLYLSTKESAGVDARLRPLCAFYLHAIALDPVSAGPAVNVPGVFLQYDPAAEVLLLEDMQYGPEWSYRRTVQSVSWDGRATVTPIDSQTLPEGGGTLLARGNRVYFDTYNEGYYLAEVAVASDGELSLGDKVKVSDSWANLLDARGASAYVVVGGGVIARYDFTGTPQLTDLVPVMSSPQRLRFGESLVYAPLGYAGLVELPL